MGTKLREFWLGSTDLAPLSLFRILYGAQLFNWIWQLYPNLSAFFTDEGILPRRSLMVSFADRFSLLNLIRRVVAGRDLLGTRARHRGAAHGRLAKQAHVVLRVRRHRELLVPPAAHA
jgi:hypothetical protein